MGSIITKIKELYENITNPNQPLTDSEWLELKKQFTHTRDESGVYWRS